MEITEGKIISIDIGSGGRFNDEIGLILKFETNAGQLSAFIGWWNTSIERNEHERMQKYSGIIRTIDGLLKTATVSKMSDLINVPVICTVDGGLVREFRVMTELFPETV